MDIVITTYAVSNRMKYINRFFKSLGKTDFPNDTKIHICDDYSHLYNEVQKLTVDNLENKVKEITFDRNDSNLGPDPTMVKYLKLYCEKTTDEYILLLNDDMIFNPQWLNATIQLISAATLEVGKVGMATVFNAEPWHPFTQHYGWYGTKDAFGAACTAFHRDVINNEKMSNKICGVDWTAAGISKTLNYMSVCSRDSYVDHIGYLGWNARPDRCDVAKNFIGE